MTKQSKYEAVEESNATKRARMSGGQSNGTRTSSTQVGAPSSTSQFEDASSVSSYSCSFENESVSTVTNDSVLKAALVLTARRGYPRRSAPTIATGRRNLKCEPVPREEAERRRVRRERNKQAAARCRQKRTEVTSSLQHTVEHLEAEKRRDEEQLRALETMRNHLQFVLAAHESVCEQHRAAHAAGQAARHGASPDAHAFGNAQNANGRPQTLLFNGGARAQAGSAITPATDLLAFADEPLVNTNGAGRSFSQQLAMADVK